MQTERSSLKNQRNPRKILHLINSNSIKSLSFLSPSTKIKPFSCVNHINTIKSEESHKCSTPQPIISLMTQKMSSSQIQMSAFSKSHKPRKIIYIENLPHNCSNTTSNPNLCTTLNSI